METNAIIIHPVRSIWKFFAHIRDDRLEPELINLNETKDIVSKLEDKEIYFRLEKDALIGKKEDVLNFLNENFEKGSKRAFVGKHEVYKTKNGKINYIHLYENNYSVRTSNEIIFSPGTPLRGTIRYWD